MRTRIIALFVLAVGLLFGCKEQAPPAEMAMEETEKPNHAEFEKKVATIKAFYQAHSDEDFDKMEAMIADSLKWSPPNYNGNEWLGKEEWLAAIKGYQDNFENIQYHSGIVMPDTLANGFWSGSAHPEGMATSGSDVIRVYGTWSATHSESGKDIGVKFFCLMTLNEANQVVQASEYFDVNGLAVQIAAEE